MDISICHIVRLPFESTFFSLKKMVTHNLKSQNYDNDLKITGMNKFEFNIAISSLGTTRVKRTNQSQYLLFREISMCYC